MTFSEKIFAIEKLLGNSKKFKDKTLLATAIYYKLRTDTSFRKVPLQNVPFTWFNLRYWMQKLSKTGRLKEIESIVEGGD